MRRERRSRSWLVNGRSQEAETPPVDQAEAATRARAEAAAKKLAAARARVQPAVAGARRAIGLHAHRRLLRLARRRAIRDGAGMAALHPERTACRQGQERQFDSTSIFPMLVVAGDDPTTGELYRVQHQYLAYWRAAASRRSTKRSAGRLLTG